MGQEKTSQEKTGQRYDRRNNGTAMDLTRLERKPLTWGMLFEMKKYRTIKRKSYQGTTEWKYYKWKVDGTIIFDFWNVGREERSYDKRLMERKILLDNELKMIRECSKRSYIKSILCLWLAFRTFVLMAYRMYTLTWPSEKDLCT